MVSPAAENSRTKACQGWGGSEAQAGEGAALAGSTGGGGIGGCTGGAHPGPISSGVLFPAPTMAAARSAQPLAPGGDNRAELASPQPQHQSRLSFKRCLSLLPAPSAPTESTPALSLSSSAPAPPSTHTTTPSIPGAPSGRGRGWALLGSQGSCLCRPAQLLDRTESLSRSIQKRCVPQRLPRLGFEVLQGKLRGWRPGPERALLGLRVGLQAY